MDSTARLPQNPTARFTGIGLAVAVHVVVILALSQALINKPKPKPAEPPISVIKEDPQVPPPIERPKAKPIELVDPTPQLWHPQPMEDVFPPAQPAPTAPVSDGPVAPPINSVAVAPTGPASVAHTGPQSVNAVCTKTMAPAMPVTNFSGDATFRVIAGTHAGRVTSVEIQAVSGGMDMRSQRAFKAAIESALREGYECASDVRFTQEFNFRVD